MVLLALHAMMVLLFNSTWILFVRDCCLMDPYQHTIYMYISVGVKFDFKSEYQVTCSHPEHTHGLVTTLINCFLSWDQFSRDQLPWDQLNFLCFVLWDRSKRQKRFDLVEVFFFSCWTRNNQHTTNLNYCHIVFYQQIFTLPNDAYIITLLCSYSIQSGLVAMVRPVRPWPYRILRENKWHCLDSNLCVCYGIASPSSSL